MSSYLGFAVTYEDEPGVIISIGSGVSVKVREHGAGSDVAESPLTTDVNGAIAAGTLADVAVGTKVHFRVENFLGMAFSIAQITR